MLTWPSNNNLALNATKTKTILFTNSQMEKLYGLAQDVVKLKCKHKTLENTGKFKLLGLTIDKNFNWKKHINNITKNCYTTISFLRKIRKYTLITVRKQLTDSLILLKLDYCNELLFGILKYRRQQLQKYKMQELISF